MSRGFKGLISLSVAVAFTAVGCVKKEGLSTEEKAKIANADRKLDEVSAKTAALEERIRKQNEEEARLEKDRAALDADIAKMNEAKGQLATDTTKLNEEIAKNTTLSGELEQKKKELEEAEARIADLEGRIDARQDKLNKDLEAYSANSAKLETDIRAAQALYASDDGIGSLLSSLIGNEAYPVLLIVAGKECTALPRIQAEIVKIDKSTPANRKYSETTNKAKTLCAGRYIVVTNSADDLKRVRNYISSNTNMALVIQPIFKIKIRTNLFVNFTNDAKPIAFWAGESSVIPVGAAYSSMNFQNISAFTTFPASCATVSPACLKDLRGPLSHDIIKGKERMSAIDELRNILEKSVEDKLEGEDKKMLFKVPVVSSLTIEHSVYVEGVAKEDVNKKIDGDLYVTNLEGQTSKVFYQAPITVKAKTSGEFAGASKRTYLAKVEALIKALEAPAPAAQ